jgi:hypothetical protein
MKRSIILSTLLLLLFSLKLASQEIKTVSSEGNLYTLEIPSTWITEAGAKGIVNLLFLGDPAHNGEMLGISATNSPMNLGKSFKTNRDALKDYKKFNIIEEGTGKLGGQDCMWLICNWTSKEGLAVRCKQYSLAYNGKNYCIQYQVDDNEYDRVSGSFEKVIETLKFSE